MNTTSKQEAQEATARIWKRLGDKDDFFDIADELSKEGTAVQNRLLNWLLTKPSYAHLKKKCGDENFFLLITQLADLDHKHDEAGLPDDLKPSTLVKHLLDNPQLLPLLPRITDKNDLGDVVQKLGENKDNLEGLVRRLALEGEGDGFPARVKRMANAGNLEGIQEIMEDLQSGGELYQIAYTMRFNTNPSLMNLVKKLMGEEKLSADLESLFNSELGRQLLAKDPEEGEVIT